MKTLFQAQQQKALALRNEAISERIDKLKKIENWVLDHRQDIREAVEKDLGKSYTESDLGEVWVTVSAARHTRKSLKKWTRLKGVGTPLYLLGSKGKIGYEPKGTCLILSPWNYPFHLNVLPLISCLAAGNTAILKPSEISPHSSKLVAKMVGDLFDTDTVAVVEGGAEAAIELLELPFNHIYYTGGTRIARNILQAAAKHLSTVTLELGGQNPTLIAPDANIGDAARKIVGGKLFNAGQTCVAPDYLLVSEEREAEFINAIKVQIQHMYANNGKEGSGYTRIINNRHFHRLKKLLDGISESGSKEFFGSPDEARNHLPPVIVTGVGPEDGLLQEEIFGPIIPVVTYSSLEKALEIIQSKPKPLCLYIFTKSREVREKVIRETSAGSVMVNDCIVQYIHHNIPFGGVGHSGMGKAHGFYGFREFSNEKPIVQQRIGYTTIDLIYPPHTKFKRFVADMLVKYF